MAAVASLFFLWVHVTWVASARANQARSVQTTPGEKKIYLTLDMDMNASMERKHLNGQVQRWYDDGVFSYLAEQHVPATFFVSGLFAKTYPELMQNLSKNPDYSFQNHSYDESSFIPKCYWLKALATDQQKIDQINATQSILKKLTGQTPTLFRYPGLCHSPHDDNLVQQLGFTIANGNLTAGDPFNHNAAAIEKKILRQAKNGSMIVMHVGGPNAPKSLEVLKFIIPQLQKEGFVFFKL